MNEAYVALPFVIGGILSVTILDIGGSILSRRFQFNYGFLAPLSLALYTVIGYYVSGLAGLQISLLASMIVGFYDATAGWKYAQIFKANTGIDEEDSKKITPSMNLTVMLFISIGFAYAGYLLR